MEENKYGKLLDDSKEYIRMRYDMLRLELLDKMTQILAMIFFGVVALVLSLTAFVYFSFALVSLLDEMLNNIVAAFCIVGGGFLLILLVVFLFRKRLFVNPLVRQLSAILFKDGLKSDKDA